jgi:2-polyprenyl-3-methyl-5-hydroxy-6-metoxy-1,4-benzoquinol methylase
MFIIKITDDYLGLPPSKKIMHNIDSCQICGSKNFNPALECIDYTVSQEKFKIVTCNGCGFLFTNPIPELQHLGNYYKSNEYISHSNTSKGLVNSIYQFVRKYTLVKKLQLINQVTGKSKEVKSLLDVGCGTGEFLNTCKNAGWNVQGIEPDTDARALGSKNYGLTVSEESQLDVFGADSFDGITMWHVLEHVPHLNERIQQLKRILKPNGKIIVAVPNCSSHDAQHYQQYWGAYDVPRHLHHFKPTDIQNLFEKNGMKVDNVLPMVFDSFYVSLLSEKYKHNKTKLFAGFFRGLISNIKAASKNNNTYSSQIYIISKQ